MRDAVANRPEGANVYIANAAYKPIRLLPLTKFSGDAAAFVFSFPENEVDGRRVYFVESRKKVRDAARMRKGSRIDDLLISPTEKNE